MPHTVTSDGKRLPAEVVRLTPAQLASEIERWRAECVGLGEACEDDAHEALSWPWVSACGGWTRRAYGLRLVGEEACVGLCLVQINARTKGARRSCVAILLLAKSPTTFAAPRVSGIGKSLVVHAVELSLQMNSGGRVRIPEAIRRGAGRFRGDPASLYRTLGFKGAETSGPGVEYEDLEITEEDAATLLREHGR